MFPITAMSGITLLVGGKTYLDAAEDYISKIRRANEKVVYGEIEMQANEHLPENLSVEIGDGVITLFDYSDGYDALQTISFRKLEDGSIEEIIKVVEELVAETNEDDNKKTITKT